MTDLLTALALVLVIEGIAWALFPDSMQRMMLHALAAPPATLRMVGLIAAVTGVAGVWVVRAALVTP